MFCLLLAATRHDPLQRTVHGLDPTFPNSASMEVPQVRRCEADPHHRPQVFPNWPVAQNRSGATVQDAASAVSGPSDRSGTEASASTAVSDPSGTASVREAIAIAKEQQQQEESVQKETGSAQTGIGNAATEASVSVSVNVATGQPPRHALVAVRPIAAAGCSTVKVASTISSPRKLGM